MKNKKLKKKKAFTLIEVIISIFVFVIIITASSGIFFSTVSSVRKARHLQQNLESAQLALNEIPKTLRTSEIVDYSEANGEIVVYDYSRTGNDNCIHYKFDNINKYLEVGSSTDDLSACSLTSVSTFNKIVNAYMEDFQIKVIESNGNTVGRVTVSALVCRELGCTGGEEVYIQSTVSLRSAL